MHTLDETSDDIVEAIRETVSKFRASTQQLAVVARSAKERQVTVEDELGHTPPPPSF